MTSAVGANGGIRKGLTGGVIANGRVRKGLIGGVGANGGVVQRSLTDEDIRASAQEGQQKLKYQS